MKWHPVGGKRHATSFEAGREVRLAHLDNETTEQQFIALKHVSVLFVHNAINSRPIPFPVQPAGHATMLHSMTHGLVWSNLTHPLITLLSINNVADVSRECN